MDLEAVLDQEAVRYIANSFKTVAALDYQTLKRVTNSERKRADERLEINLTPADSLPNFSYSPEELFAEQPYGNPPSSALDYEKLFSDEKRQGQTEEKDYASSTAASEVQSLVITPEEAEKTMREMEMDQALGTPYDTDSETREKMDYFIMFNLALFHAFELQSVTRNTNYGRLR